MRMAVLLRKEGRNKSHHHHDHHPDWRLRNVGPIRHTRVRLKDRQREKEKETTVYWTEADCCDGCDCCMTLPLLFSSTSRRRQTRLPSADVLDWIDCLDQTSVVPSDTT